jgi:hypothetical protein
MLSHTLTQTLIRWIVDLNFGTDVAAPVLTREFRIEESPLTMPDVSLLIQSGYTPRKEWIERHFRVELEEKKEEGEEGESTTFDPEQDKDLFGSIFGAEGAQAGAAPAGNTAAAQEDMNKAAGEMETPAGATPEESQADAIGEPSAEDQLEAVVGGIGEEPGATPEEAQTGDEGEGDDFDTLFSPEELQGILGEDEGEEEPAKPFGNQGISEDEAVEMDRK